MSSKMLEFCQLVISKVSFDKTLVIKEIRKSVKLLSHSDLALFQIWCYREFGKFYRQDLDLIFIRNS